MADEIDLPLMRSALSQIQTMQGTVPMHVMPPLPMAPPLLRASQVVQQMQSIQAPLMCQPPQPMIYSEMQMGRNEQLQMFKWLCKCHDICSKCHQWIYVFRRRSSNSLHSQHWRILWQFNFHSQTHHRLCQCQTMAEDVKKVKQWHAEGMLGWPTPDNSSEE